MWTWDPDHEEATASFPFVSGRDARQAASAIGSGRARESGQVYVGVGAGARWVTVTIELESPDSYSREWNERNDDPEAYVARTRAMLDAAAAGYEAVIIDLGLRSGAIPSANPEVERAFDRVQREFARRMPPTRRTVRDCTTIREQPGPEVVFCDFATGLPTERVPLMIGESYWTTGSNPISTVDVAPVPDSALAALAGTRSDIDLRAFLARELQYGPLDIARARERLQRAWLEAREALPAIALATASETAIHNSEIIRARRGDIRVYRPWSEDASFLIPE